MFLRLPGLEKLHLIIGGGSLPVKVGVAELFRLENPAKIDVVPGVGHAKMFGTYGLCFPRVMLQKGVQTERIIQAIRDSDKVILFKNAVELMELPLDTVFPDQELWIATRTTHQGEYTNPMSPRRARLVEMFPKRIVYVNIDAFLAEKRVIVPHIPIEFDPLLKMMCENENYHLREKIGMELSTLNHRLQRTKATAGFYDVNLMNLIQEKLAYLRYLVEHPGSGVIGAQVIPFILAHVLAGTGVIQQTKNVSVWNSRTESMEETTMESYELKDLMVGRMALVDYMFHACCCVGGGGGGRKRRGKGDCSAVTKV
jgi:hypothetical protein